MPYNLNMENIIKHNKTRDMLPSISSTILHVRYSEHANWKSVQSSPIWRYMISLCCVEFQRWIFKGTYILEIRIIIKMAADSIIWSFTCFVLNQYKGWHVFALLLFLTLYVCYKTHCHYSYVRSIGSCPQYLRWYICWWYQWWRYMEVIT